MCMHAKKSSRLLRRSRPWVVLICHAKNYSEPTPNGVPKGVSIDIPTDRLLPNECSIDLEMLLPSNISSVPLKFSFCNHDRYQQIMYAAHVYFTLRAGRQHGKYACQAHMSLQIPGNLFSNYPVSNKPFPSQAL